MAHLLDSCIALLAPFRSLSVPGKMLPGGDSLEDDIAAHVLDVLDRMEKGLVREPVGVTTPLPDIHGLWRFSVERSGDRREYYLYRNDETLMLYAKVSRVARQVDIFLDSPRGAGTLFDPDRPAFVLTCDASKSEWRLLQIRCDDESGARREIMCARHFKFDIGAGINHGMQVEIPPQEGSSASVGVRRYVTKVPVWHEESMVLEFENRQIDASAKNFQLMLEGDTAEMVVCQHAKISADEFCLDFKVPVTAVQAFGLSLTTLFWV